MNEKITLLTGDQCTVDLEIKEEYRAQLPQIIDEIIESCKTVPTIAHYDTAMIPSKESVIEILEDLKDLLFPGYFRHQGFDSYSLSYHLGNLVNDIFEKLAAQIARSIRHECRRLHSLCTRCLERGQKDSLAFLKKVPAVREILAGDVQAAYDGDPAAKSLDEIIFSYPCILAITVYRVAHELHVQGVPVLPRIMTEYAHGVTGIDIHPGAKIGKNFFIDHGTGVVIGETTEIGDRVKIYQGVTLGALSFPKDGQGNLIRGVKRHPTIEDDVTIYSNATILGPTVIGTRSVIGGNVWITRDVPPDTMVTIEQPHLQLKGGTNRVGSFHSDP
jgi:serine O-acetyltransferase